MTAPATDRCGHDRTQLTTSHVLLARVEPPEAVNMAWSTIPYLLIAAAALAVETITILDKRRGDTISEHVWALTGVRRKRWTIQRWLLAAFMTWLTLHLVLGW